MTLSVQLDLFEENDDFTLLLNEIDNVRKECSNVRRGIFSRLDGVKKEVYDIVLKQQEEIEFLKKKLEMLDFLTVQNQAM